jgi:hypothetical protein
MNITMTMCSCYRTNRASAFELLNIMDTKNITGTDTVNIMLTDCLKYDRYSFHKAEDMYKKYFTTRSSWLQPTTVTLNIMIEGARELNNQFALTNYYKQFRPLGIYITIISLNAYKNYLICCICRIKT